MKNMLKKTLLMLLATMLIAVLIGCNKADNNDVENNNNSSQNSLENYSDNSDPVNSYDGTITDFAVNLLKVSNYENQNVLISPLSLMNALALAGNGAKGETLSQIEQSMGMSIDTLNEQLKNYSVLGSQLYLSNTAWFKENQISLNQDYVQKVGEKNNAGVFVKPFDKTTLDEINQCVNNATNGIIENVLSDIDNDAAAYLINALSFFGEWEIPYAENQLSEKNFVLSNGNKQTVTFMTSTETTYLDDENSKGFVKYYKDEKYAFVGILPDENITLQQYISSLNGEKIDNLINNSSKKSVIVSVPKFTVEYDSEMTDTLKHLGITDAFDSERADFSGIGSCRNGNLVISKVLHKTKISFNEKGTEAGASTVIEMAPTSGQLTYTLDFNRPFVYMLIDCETNLPIFIGTISSVN